MAALVAGALLIAGLVLSGRHDDGVGAATAAVAAPVTTAVAAPGTTAPATPLTPAPGAAGRPLLAPAAYASRHGVLDVTLVASSSA